MASAEGLQMQHMQTAAAASPPKWLGEQRPQPEDAEWHFLPDYTYSVQLPQAQPCMLTVTRNQRNIGAGQFARATTEKLYQQETSEKCPAKLDKANAACKPQLASNY